MNDMLALGCIVIITFLPVLLWSGLLLRADKRKEPILLLVFAFLVGALSTVPILLLRIGMDNLSWLYASWSGLTLGIGIILSAAIEEGSKHIGAMKVAGTDHRGRDEVTDGIVYGMVVGLGFAFVENAVYLWESYLHSTDLIQLLQLYVIRSTHTMVAHALFSGIFGYFYALGFICPDMRYIKTCVYRINASTLRSVMDMRTLLLSATRTILFQKKGDYYFDGLTLLVEGFIIAILLHTIYNVILSTKLLGEWYLVILSGYLAILGFFVITRLGKREG